MSSPVTAPASARRGLWRWSVAAVATATLVASGSGLVVFAQSGTAASQGPVFAPADAVAYVEARLDMPAGQADAVAQMLTAFPGFADAGAFDLKMDELLGMAASELGMEGMSGDLIGDVLTGEVGIAIGGLEGAVTGSGDAEMLLGLATADAAAAGVLLDGLLADSATDMTTETYNDVVIRTDTTQEPPMSVAIHGDWLLMGTGPATVQEAIDVLDGSAAGLAADADFSSAWARLPEARLGAAWVDTASFGSMIELAAMMAGNESGMALPTEDLVAMLPTDMTASLVAESDRLTLEATVTPSAQTPAVPVGESELAMVFPADTQLYIETRELGATVEGALNAVADLLASQELSAGDDIEAMGGSVASLFGEESPFRPMLGAPLPQVLDFVSDAGIGAGLSSDGLWLGIAAEVNDPDAASQRVTKLLTLLQMMAMDPEMGVTFETADVGGVEVNSIMLPLDEMLAQTGLPLSLGDSIDVALADDTLLIGTGDFVESALASDGAESLGSSDGYVDALAGQTVNAGVMYMDLGALLTALDPILSMLAPEWTELAPYAAGLDRMVVVNSADDEAIRSRMTMIVGQ